MRPSRIDVVQMFDLDLNMTSRVPDPRTLLNAAMESETFGRYESSFLWLFEPQSVLGGPSERAKDPTLRFLSQAVNCAYSPPGFDRLALVKDPHDPSDHGGVITLSSNLQAGVVCTWKSYPGEADALALKHSLSVDIPQHFLTQLKGLFPYITESSLMYPFIGLRYQTSDLSGILREDGVFLGTLLSGGLDHESDETMRSYVSASLSLRRYEGLFLQSSGGIGVYGNSTESTEAADLELYENTLFRAVQVCELCLLEQRLLRTFKTNVDEDAKKVGIFPRPIMVEKHREKLLTLENEMVKSLPFRTPESTPLIRKAQDIFRIPIFLQDAKDSYNFLEGRYQNTKTSALAAVAVLTYILDKLNVWDAIDRYLSHYF